MGQFDPEADCHIETNPMQDMHFRVPYEVNHRRGWLDLEWRRDHSMGTIVFVFKSLPLPQVSSNVRRCDCSSEGEEIIMPRFLNAALLGAALLVPVAIAPTILRAQAAVVYHDKGHN